MIRIVVRAANSEDGGEPHEFPDSGPVWIGRDIACDVQLCSELVSRRHACVEFDGARLSVQDISANGSTLDGEPLTKQRRDAGLGALLQVGPFELDLWAGVKPQGSHAVDRRRRIHHALLDELDLVALERGRAHPDALRPQVGAALQRLCAGEPDAEALVAQLLDEVLGLGPLQALLEDDEVSEIMVVHPESIYVERAGRLQHTELRFTDDASVQATIERIVAPLGRRIDESTPLVDARLPDGSRVNAIIPPLARRGPCITIRKFQRRPLGFADLVRTHSMSIEMADFLDRAVRARRNIVVSGGTGSGKTTLLNVLSSSIDEGERIITIEDAAELQLAQQHVVSLESRPQNLEGQGEYSIGDLLRNALRMRPDRIIVGECRGGEAVQMLQAMNTGHDGSMTTTHANSPDGAARRLEVLCLMAGVDMPLSAIRHQIAGSIDLIVQQARLGDGSRRVVAIAEVVGIDEDGRVQLQDLYRASPPRDGGEPAFRPTGHLASFAPLLAALPQERVP